LEQLISGTIGAVLLLKAVVPSEVIVMLELELQQRMAPPMTVGTIIFDPVLTGGAAKTWLLMKLTS